MWFGHTVRIVPSTMLNISKWQLGWVRHFLDFPIGRFLSFEFGHSTEQSLPACFGDDHLCSDIMEPLPEVSTL